MLATACPRASPARRSADWVAGPSVTSDPPGAEIRLDGEPLGRRTPSRIETWEPLVPHEISLVLPGHVPWREELPAGRPPDRIDARLPPAGYLAVKSEPPGAAIRVEGHRVATAPATVPVPAGRTVALALSADGYLDWSREAVADAGTTLPFDVHLAPAAAADVHSDPPGAWVTVDGRPAGRAPARLAVRAGVDHVVRFSLPGLAGCERRVRIRWKARARIDCDLTDAEGRKLASALAATRARIAVLGKRLAAIPDHDSNFFRAMANDKSRNEIEDELTRLSDDEDQEQTAFEDHRADLGARFARDEDGGSPPGTEESGEAGAAP